LSKCVLQSETSPDDHSPVIQISSVIVPFYSPAYVVVLLLLQVQVFKFCSYECPAYCSPTNPVLMLLLDCQRGSCERGTRGKWAEREVGFCGWMEMEEAS
jgi:hypothetical protein